MVTSASQVQSTSTRATDSSKPSRQASGKGGGVPIRQRRKGRRGKSKWPAPRFSVSKSRIQLSATPSLELLSFIRGPWKVPGWPVLAVSWGLFHFASVTLC